VKVVNQVPKAFRADIKGREKATEVVDNMIKQAKERAHLALKRHFLTKRES